MKKKGIKVIVEGRISDSEMQNLNGGYGTCQNIPGGPYYSISPCYTNIGGEYNSNPNPCPTYSNCSTYTQPPVCILHFTPPPCASVPGGAITHFDRRPVF